MLIVASGSATHNLRAFGQYQIADAAPEWVSAFENWLVDAVERGDTDSWLSYETAPSAKENHPTPEHLLPLFVAIGAGDRTAGQTLHRSYTYGTFSMAAFRFN